MIALSFFALFTFFLLEKDAFNYGKKRAAIIIKQLSKSKSKSKNWHQ
jgi:hypothetical protein